MQIEETGLKGALIIIPAVYTDDRGYFFESYHQLKMDEESVHFHPVQDNESFSYRGTIRGLHFQRDESAQSKLIRVVQGEVKEVIVDLRAGSETYGQKFEATISAENKKQLFVPKGFANGFGVLSESAIVLYKCDNYYNPTHEGGLNVLDPELGINWGIEEEEMIISSKDQSLPTLKELNYAFNG